VNAVMPLTLSIMLITLLPNQLKAAENRAHGVHGYTQGSKPIADKDDAVTITLQFKLETFINHLID
jgi:hypothetical protein